MVQSNLFSSANNIEPLTLQEVMNDFIDSIDFSNPCVLKGYQALNKYLIGTSNRYTTDIDMHFMDLDSWNQFKSSMIDNANINDLGIVYSIADVREGANSSSLTIQASYKSHSYKFKLDMNIEPNLLSYAKSFSNKRIVSLERILADKLAVSCSRKINRRIKDLIDIYFIMESSDIEISKVVECIKSVGYADILSSGDCYILNPDSTTEIINSYMKYKNINIPDFKSCVARVCDLVIRVKSELGNYDGVKWVWVTERKEWIPCS